MDPTPNEWEVIIGNTFERQRFNLASFLGHLKLGASLQRCYSAAWTNSGVRRSIISQDFRRTSSDFHSALLDQASTALGETILTRNDLYLHLWEIPWQSLLDESSLISSLVQHALVQSYPQVDRLEKGPTVPLLTGERLTILINERSKALGINPVYKDELAKNMANTIIALRVHPREECSRSVNNEKTTTAATCSSPTAGVAGLFIVIWDESHEIAHHFRIQPTQRLPITFEIGDTFYTEEVETPHMVQTARSFYELLVAELIVPMVDSTSSYNVESITMVHKAMTSDEVVAALYKSIGYIGVEEDEALKKFYLAFNVGLEEHVQDPETLFKWMKSTLYTPAQIALLTCDTMMRMQGLPRITELFPVDDASETSSTASRSPLLESSQGSPSTPRESKATPDSITSCVFVFPSSSSSFKLSDLTSDSTSSSAITSSASSSSSSSSTSSSSTTPPSPTSSADSLSSSARDSSSDPSISGNMENAGDTRTPTASPVVMPAHLSSASPTRLQHSRSLPSIWDEMPHWTGELESPFRIPNSSSAAELITPRQNPRNNTLQRSISFTPDDFQSNRHVSLAVANELATTSTFEPALQSAAPLKPSFLPQGPSIGLGHPASMTSSMSVTPVLKGEAKLLSIIRDTLETCHQGLLQQEDSLTGNVQREIVKSLPPFKEEASSRLSTIEVAQRIVSALKEQAPELLAKEE